MVGGEALAQAPLLRGRLAFMVDDNNNSSESCTHKRELEAHTPPQQQQSSTKFILWCFFTMLLLRPFPSLNGSPQSGEAATLS